MEKLCIAIHSVVDVITNSSTVIYTYHSGSVEPAKELINEVLKLLGETKKADDVFYFGVFCDLDTYSEYESESKPDLGSYKEVNKKVQEIIHKILIGKIKKPEWMSNAEECGDWAPSNYLHILPKDKKYLGISEKIKALLGSIDADGGRDG